MVDGLNNIHKVERGECAWKVASKELQKRNGTKPTNGEIIKEMNRLAELNGCESVDDFNKKFFSRVGGEFITEKANENPPATEEKAAPQTPSEPADSTKVSQKKPPEAPATPIDTTKVEKPVVPEAPVTPKTQKEKEIERINNLPTDTDRIIEYNKKNYDYQYYGIVDKKSCKLKIYNKEGEVVKEFTVGVGKNKGDNLQSYYMERAEKTKDAGLAESGRYTTAGEFTLDEQKTTSDAYTGKDGKAKMMALKGDNRGVRSGQMAIHMLYKPAYESRKRAIDSPGLEDNRMSYGCVNLTEEDYDIMHSYLGEGNKIFVLPEEKGNKLLLEKQKDGSYKFEQQHHKNAQRGVSKEVASAVNYDVKPQNNPKYIAEQKRKNEEAEQQRLLAEQRIKEQRQKEEEKANEFAWYNPFTWFS